MQSASRLGRFRVTKSADGTRYIGSWVGTRTGLDLVKENTVVCPYLE